MADIQLRFHKDMLVLTSPVKSELKRLGIDTARDGELTMLIEPEVIEDAYKMEAFAGAQCMVANTGFITPARLAHTGMRQRAAELALSAVSIVRSFNPQHVLVEINPCNLPLDVSSKASLNENCDQYKRAAQLFGEMKFDAFFLNGFRRVADLKCALIGLRKVSSVTAFASVDVNCEGYLPSGETIEEAASVMAEYGAQVMGFETSAPAEDAASIAERMSGISYLPILAQLEVKERNSEQADATPENPYFEPDTMVDAADLLRESGVQFLRAVGDATPAYTGALVAATSGMDVANKAFETLEVAAKGEEISSVAERLRNKVKSVI